MTYCTQSILSEREGSEDSRYFGANYRRGIDQLGNLGGGDVRFKESGTTEAYLDITLPHHAMPLLLPTPPDQNVT